MANFIKVTALYFKMLIRSKEFIFAVFAVLFFGLFVIPNEDSSYATFYVGQYTGKANAVWVSNIGAVFSNMIICLVGFFFLEGRYSREATKGLGSLLRVTRFSNFYLIAYRWLAFVIALFLMLAILILTIFVTNYEDRFQVIPFIKPFLYYNVPFIILIASVILAFDVLVPSRAIKITIYLFFVMTLMSLSTPFFDFLGVTEFIALSKIKFAEITDKLNHAFGIIVKSSDLKYVVFSTDDLITGNYLNKFMSILFAFSIILSSSLFFGRFKKTSRSTPKPKNIAKEPEGLQVGWEGGKQSSNKFRLNKNYQSLFHVNAIFFRTAFSNTKILVILALWVAAFFAPDTIRLLGIMPLLFITSFFLLENFVNIEQERNLQVGFKTSIYTDLETTIMKVGFLLGYFILISIPSFVFGTMATNITLLAFLIGLTVVPIGFTKFFQSIKLIEIAYLVFFISYLTGYPILNIF